MDLPDGIIEGCRKRSQAAQAALYALLAPKLLAVCYRYLQNRDEAEDAMQDTFIKIFTSIKTFRGDHNIEGWTRRIAVNTSLDILRRKKRIRFDVSLTLIENMCIEEEEADLFCGEELLSCFKRLPEGYRTIVNLYAVEEYRHAEIAKMLNISEATSRSQYFRARQMLIRLLREKFDLIDLKKA